MGGLYYPPDVIGAGISLYYEGLPYREAAETLGKKIQSSIYPKTIRDWVHQFSAEGFPEIPGPQTSLRTPLVNLLPAVSRQNAGVLVGNG